MISRFEPVDGKQTEQSRLFTIRNIMIGAGIVLMASVATTSYLSHSALSLHRVGGPEYMAIANGKDLIADYVPPPLLPYEAFSLAHTAARVPGVDLNDFEKRWSQTHADFDARLGHWTEVMMAEPFLDKQKWSIFQNGLKSNGDVFWKNLEGSVIPALKSHEQAAIDAALQKLTVDFRKFVDFTVDNDDFLTENIASREKENLASSSHDMMKMTVISIALSAFLLLLSFLGQKFIVSAIRKLSTTMTRLAEGDTGVEVPYENRSDEIGVMARAVTVFKHQTKRNQDAAHENKYVIQTLGEGLEKMSNGNLSYRLTQPFPAALDALRERFNTSIGALQETISSVRDGTFGIKSGTEEIAQASDDLSRRTESQAASLEETAAAVAEITAKVKQTASGASHARSVVEAAKNQANRSGEIVQRAVAAMQEIKDSSQKITSIIGVIDEIAFQTNLLALNAGVEAARAGDAGRGFAVVASEVRSLAQRSADAAREIKGILMQSHSAVDNGVGLVSETGSSLQSIIDRVSEITGVINEIAVSAEQQASGLHEVNSAVDQMDQVTQQNASMVEQTTAATRMLTNQSVELARLVSRFTVAAMSQAASSRSFGAGEATPKRHVPAPRAQRMARAASTSSAADDWQEF